MRALITRTLSAILWAIGGALVATGFGLLLLAVFVAGLSQ